MNLHFVAVAALLVPLCAHADPAPQATTPTSDQKYLNWVQPIPDGERRRADVPASDAKTHVEQSVQAAADVGDYPGGVGKPFHVAPPRPDEPVGIPESDIGTHELLAQILTTLRQIQVQPEACEPGRAMSNIPQIACPYVNLEKSCESLRGAR